MVYINNNLYSVEITTTERRKFENSFFFSLFSIQMSNATIRNNIYLQIYIYYL